MVRGRRLSLVGLTLMALALGMPAFAQQTVVTPADQKPLSSRVPLKVGILASVGLGNVFVAKNFGYFSDEKLDVQTDLLVNTQDALVLLAQGRYDAITGSISAGMLNAIATGLNVRIVSAMSTTAPIPGLAAPSPGGVYIRKDLYDKGEVKTFADMKGRTIGSVGGLGTSVSYLIGLYARRANLTLNDVKLESYSNADMIAALKSKRIDLGYLTSPFSQEAVDQGLAVELGDGRDVYGKETQAAIMFGPNLLEKDKAAGVAFMRAMVRATADLKGDYRKDDRLIHAIAVEMKAPDESVRRSPPYTFTLDFNPNTILDAQKMFFDTGKILSYDKPLTADQIINTTMLAAARAP